MKELFAGLWVGKKNIVIDAVALCVFWFFAAPVAGDTLRGKVVAVMSGDTLSIQTEDGGVYKIRLMGIDAPELSQTFGKQSRDFTWNLVIGKTVTVNFSLVDKYQRRIGSITLPDGSQLDEVIVSSGHAWHYRAIHPVSEVLYRMEKEARENRLGLWVDDWAIAPWEYRLEESRPSPPLEPQQMDYDRYFDYGLIGNRKTQVYLWPECGNYPENKEEWVWFGSLAAAKAMGYRIDSNCPQTDAKTP